MKSYTYVYCICLLNIYKHFSYWKRRNFTIKHLINRNISKVCMFSQQYHYMLQRSLRTNHVARSGWRIKHCIEECAYQKQWKTQTVYFFCVYGKIWNIFSLTGDWYFSEEEQGHVEVNKNIFICKQNQH